MNISNIGVIGGMGPHATAEAFKKLVSMFEAKKDWDYPRIIVDCNSKIPSRVRSLLYNDVSPTTALIQTAKNLVNLGSELIIMPCVTAHHFIHDMEREIDVPIVNMISEITSELERTVRRKSTIAILGSEATCKNIEIESPLVKSLEGVGYSVLESNTPQLIKVRKCIEILKQKGLNANASKLMRELISQCTEEGADIIVLACSEFTMFGSKFYSDVPVVDSIEILCRSVVNRIMIK